MLSIFLCIVKLHFLWNHANRHILIPHPHLFWHNGGEILVWILLEVCSDLSFRRLVAVVTHLLILLHHRGVGIELREEGTKERILLRLAWGCLIMNGCIFLLLLFNLLWFFKTIIDIFFRINRIIDWPTATTFKFFLQPFISMLFLYKLRTFSSLILMLDFKGFSYGRSRCILLSLLFSTFDFIEFFLETDVLLFQEICLSVLSLLFWIDFWGWLRGGKLDESVVTRGRVKVS